MRGAKRGESTTLPCVSWPLISVSGGPRERGRAYGEQARDRIHGTIELYEQLIGYHTALTWPQIRDLAGPFAEPLNAYDERLLPEMEGIAGGAGVDAEDILAINLRTELLSVRRAPGAASLTECTVLSAISVDPPGHVLIAQNWDWTPRAAETCVVLAATPTQGPGFVTVVEAGLLAKCGANTAGIGVVTNALESSRDRGEPGVPFHAVLRRILTSSSFEEAVDAVMAPTRSSSGNYLIASADGRSAGLETGPGGPEMVTRFEGPGLVHTNHFLRTGAPFKDMALLEPGSTSRHRQERAAGGLEARAGRGMQGLLEVLRDHEGRPGSVCKHRNQTLDQWDDSVTVATMAADLTEGAIWVSQGPSCEAQMEVFSI